MSLDTICTELSKAGSTPSAWCEPRGSCAVYITKPDILLMWILSDLKCQVYGREGLPERPQSIAGWWRTSGEVVSPRVTRQRLRVRKVPFSAFLFLLKLVCFLSTLVITMSWAILMWKSWSQYSDLRKTDIGGWSAVIVGCNNGTYLVGPKGVWIRSYVL